MIKTRAIAVFILIGAALVGFFNYSSQMKPDSAVGRFPFKLGLDLAGGSHLVYQADLSAIPASEAADSMAALQNVIERRVNAFGVSEPLVEVQGNNQLIVELPGVTDVNQAIANIGQTPVLDFRLLASSTQTSISASTTMTSDEKTAAIAAAFQPTGLTGRMLKSAALNYDSTSGQPVVSLNFNSEGTALFASLTKNNIGNVLGIFLDGQPISLPVVQSEIPNGQAQITGAFDVPTAQTLVRNLNYGALPVPINLLSTQTIGASLGQSAIMGGIEAGILAFIIIAIFLVLWYRLPGIVAVVSLGVYTMLMLAIFKLLPVTLTAEGIAGFILSIGMAVDANILIFERMKEELRKGLPIEEAMHQGFARAWLSIRDSNISSIITGCILYYFGSSSVITGFALVFTIGVIVSMFTAISASRFFLYAIGPKKGGRIGRFLFSNGFRFSKNTPATINPTITTQ
jgi:protein-export membrane protein SecD